MISEQRAKRVLSAFNELSLLSTFEVDGLLSFFSPSFPFASALAAADSVHVHGRVDAVSEMPHAQIRGLGGCVENERDGYIKYAFDGGVNMIYSSIDVAEDDLLGDRSGSPPRPFVDHVGIDLRREIAEVKALFDEAPEKAKALGWRHAAQGKEGKPVYCCHTSVGLKHWVYPTGNATFQRPIELAYGALDIHSGKMGCDLRPIDPAHPLATKAVCGAKTCG